MKYQLFKVWESYAPSETYGRGKVKIPTVFDKIPSVFIKIASVFVKIPTVFAIFLSAPPSGSMSACLCMGLNSPLELISDHYMLNEKKKYGDCLGIIVEMCKFATNFYRK